MLQSLFSHVLSSSKDNNPLHEAIEDEMEDNSDVSVTSCDLPKDEEEEPIVNKEPLTTRNVFTNVRYELYVYDVRTLFRLVDNWSFNRKVRQHHVISIYDDLKKMRHPHLLGTIKIVRTMEGVHKVIDGQHRLLAIRKILEEDETMMWNMDVTVEVYVVTSNDSEYQTCDLFVKANKNMNMVEEDSLDQDVIMIINGLCQDKILSRGIIDKQDGSIYRPRISKKDLYELFKQYYKPRTKMNVDDVISKVGEINRMLGLISDRKLFHKPESEAAKKQKVKADKFKFYLNMAESNFPPKVWIPYIYSQKPTFEKI